MQHREVLSLHPGKPQPAIWDYSDPADLQTQVNMHSSGQIGAILAGDMATSVTAHCASPLHSWDVL